MQSTDLCEALSTVSVADIGVPYRLCTRDILSRLLDDYESTTNQLFENLANVISNKAPNPTMMEKVMTLTDKLVTTDVDVQTVVEKAKEQLDRQQEISRVREEITQKEQIILKAVQQMRDAEQSLATSLFQASHKLDATKQATANAVPSEELIKFAFRISSGHSVEAPEDWLPGDPRRPYPLDMEMRAGALGKLSQKTSGIPLVTTTAAVEPQASDSNVDDDMTGNGATYTFNMKEEPLDDGPVVVPGGSEDGQVAAVHRNNELWAATDATNDDMSHLAMTNDDMSHLAMMPVSAMMSGTTNGISVDEHAEFMSNSSDSSSSGESAT